MIQVSSRNKWGLALLLAASTGLTAPPARATLFSNPINPLSLLIGMGAPTTGKPTRIQVGMYYTHWGVPSSQLVTVPGVSLHQKQQASPLFTADYFINPRVSVGGFWNPLRGHLDATNTATGAKVRLADTKEKFYELHATYYFPAEQAKGLSLQAGYVVDDTHYSYLNGAKASRKASAPSFWVNYSAPINAAKEGMTVKAPVSVFGSVGYYASDKFNNAASLLAGASVGVSKNVDLSASWWLLDVTHSSSSRFTLGASGKF